MGSKFDDMSADEFRATLTALLYVFCVGLSIFVFFKFEFQTFLILLIPILIAHGYCLKLFRKYQAIFNSNKR